LQAFYSDQFVLPLPPGHRFPMRKYRLIREMAEARVPDLRLLPAAPATPAELCSAHTVDYVERVCSGRLDAREQREIGFPWSSGMVERSRRSAGATLAACRAALVEGVAVNLAGGTHHAYANKGSGFCVFNDAAIAVRVLQAEAQARADASAPTPTQAHGALPIAIVDLDVHQGNGTAAILRGTPGVFTLSLHGEKNFPFRKEYSDLDVPLPDGTGDEDYLRALAAAFDTLFARFAPRLIIYLAGADPYQGDRLGRLALTPAGLERRDVMVFERAALADVPVAVTMAGGYASVIEESCAIHATTVAVAARYWRHHADRLAGAPVAQGAGA